MMTLHLFNKGLDQVQFMFLSLNPFKIGVSTIYVYIQTN
jgi:hypothetical protein